MTQPDNEPLQHNALGQEIVYNQCWSAQTPGTYADLNKPLLAWHLADILERERVNGRDITQLLQYLSTLTSQQQHELDEALDTIAESYDDRLAEPLADLSDEVAQLLRQQAGMTEPSNFGTTVINSDTFEPPSTGKNS